MRLTLLHPGQMGVTIGRALMVSGHEVAWVAHGRSDATADRAAQAGFVRCERLDLALKQADGVLSVCPPAEAETQLDAVMACGYAGLYVDANAVAPQTAQRMAVRFGDHYVDGGIVGPPAHAPGSTRMYVSGRHATRVADWFSDGILGVVPVGADPTAASSVKMCYAAFTKGSSALLLAVRALARALDVEDALLSEWQISQKGLGERSEMTARGTAGKAWRFTGEMREIAQTFAGVQLPTGFHQAAEEVYESMAPLKDSPGADLQQVLACIVHKKT